MSESRIEIINTGDAGGAFKAEMYRQEPHVELSVDDETFDILLSSDKYPLRMSGDEARAVIEGLVGAIRLRERLIEKQKGESP